MLRRARYCDSTSPRFDPTAAAAGRSTCSRTPFDSPLLAEPTAGVPVPAILRRVERDDDLVSLAGPYLVVAPRAAVGLLRLVRLHVTDFNLVVRHRGSAAHSTS